MLGESEGIAWREDVQVEKWTAMSLVWGFFTHGFILLVMGIMGGKGNSRSLMLVSKSWVTKCRMGIGWHWIFKIIGAEV